MRSGLGPALALAVLLPARAEASGQALSIELVPKAQVGQGQPALVVRAHERLASLRVRLERSGGGRGSGPPRGPSAPGLGTRSRSR